MPMVRAMRMLNAIEAGTTTGAQLQTLLTADPGRLAEFNVLLGMRGQARRMAASNTSMTAVVASSTAMAAVVASSTAMAAVAASSTAMALVAASSTVMIAVAASSAAMNALVAFRAAKMAVFNSDTAINAIAVSATALASIRSATQYAILNTGGSGSLASAPGTIAGTDAAGSYLAVGVSTSDPNTGATITLATRRSGSARLAINTTAADNVALTTALGVICLPMVSPFTITSTDTSSQIGYVGMLRCDI